MSGKKHIFFSCSYSFFLFSQVCLWEAVELQVTGGGVCRRVSSASLEVKWLYRHGDTERSLRALNLKGPSWSFKPSDQTKSFSHTADLCSPLRDMCKRRTRYQLYTESHTTLNSPNQIWTSKNKPNVHSNHALGNHRAQRALRNIRPISTHGGEHPTPTSSQKPVMSPNDFKGKRSRSWMRPDGSKAFSERRGRTVAIWYGAGVVAYAIIFRVTMGWPYLISILPANQRCQGWLP